MLDSVLVLTNEDMEEANLLGMQDCRCIWIWRKWWDYPDRFNGTCGSERRDKGAWMSGL